MLRHRFSLVSASAMLIAAAFAALLILRHQSDGFGGHRGFPFAWYSWIDVVIDGKLVGEYQWAGLVADFVIWIATVLALGLWVGRVERRFKQPAPKTTPPDKSLERTSER